MTGVRGVMCMRFLAVSGNCLFDNEFSALQSLHARNDIVIKPADKGGALVVWRADIYRNEAHRQLGDATFYRRVDKDLTSIHQTTITQTIHNFI